METLWVMIKAFVTGVVIALVGFTALIIVGNWLFAAPALGSPPYTTTREATLGEQDRSVTYQGPEYDNSDFLSDMDDIAAGKYVYAPLEPKIRVCDESETMNALMQQNLYLIERLAELEAQ